MSNGKNRYSKCNRFRKSAHVTSAIPPSRAANHAPLRNVNAGPDEPGSRLRRNGATRSTPIASPVHQTAHVGQKSDGDTVPESTSTEVPTDALIDMLTRAPR